MVNTSLMNEKIRNSGKKVKFLAQKLGMSVPTFIKKKKGDSEFSVSEALLLCYELDVRTKDEMCKIFMSKG